MRFAHIADVHIGGWREAAMKELNVLAFVRTIDICISRKVDFVLIAGDLFNTSMPSLDSLKITVKKLKELKDNGIPVYIIAGSHDFSPSGKTMLDILEEAGLSCNAMKGRVENKKLYLDFVEDPKTCAKITGMIGKKGSLEKSFYEILDAMPLEREEGFKIFMFHTAISELKPKEMENMDSSPVSFLPRGFDYYAGGHVHIIRNESIDGYSNVVYPGPVFPNNFRELEELGHGGFYIYDDSVIEYVPVEVMPVRLVVADCTGFGPEAAKSLIIEKANALDVKDCIVLIRANGVLESGKVSDIGFPSIIDDLYSKGAYAVLKNTYQLKTKEFEEIQMKKGSSEDIEEALIDEHLSQMPVPGWDERHEKEVIKGLIKIFESEKKEGEKVYEKENRIIKEADAFFSDMDI